jgi:hypothetical protein
MARDPLTPAADGPEREIAAYLAALDAALPGPRRARATIVDEIGDGLVTAADRQCARGAIPAAAVRAALSEFGPPHLVARSFAGELATAGTRRLLATLLLTGPLVGVWWLLLLAPGHWPPRPPEVLAAIPVLPVVGAMIAMALAVLAATGRLAHRLPPLSVRSTVRTGRAAANACLVVDVALLGQLAIVAAAPRGHSPVIMAAAAAASLVRLCCVLVATRGHRWSMPS